LGQCGVLVAHLEAVDGHGGVTEYHPGAVEDYPGYKKITLGAYLLLLTPRKSKLIFLLVVTMPVFRLVPLDSSSCFSTLL
jgi:hypothetical protein